jgi:hypothetical protein
MAKFSMGFKDHLKTYFYETYEGFNTVELLKQKYIFVPENVKDVYFNLCPFTGCVSSGFSWP